MTPERLRMIKEWAEPLPRTSDDKHAQCRAFVRELVQALEVSQVRVDALENLARWIKDQPCRG